MHEFLFGTLVLGALFQLRSCLALGGILFAIGAWGVLARRNVLIVLISIELMLNAVNLVFASFARSHANLAAATIRAIDEEDEKLQKSPVFRELSMKEREERLAPLNQQRAEARTAGQTGHIFALFIIAVAAAEAAVGLAIVITFFRNRETVDTRDMRTMSQ